MNTMNQNKESSSSSSSSVQKTSSNPPMLPPLYFAEKDEQKHQSNNKKTSAPFAIEPLPSEILSNIASYLDWGDYARLSVTNSSFQTIVHDAATTNNQKYDLSMSLLNGTNGLMCNPKLAMRYLHDLAGINVSKDDFNPSYEAQKNNENNDNNDDDKLNHATIAMNKLAKCYLEGNGIEKDLTLGLAWLKAAHHHGDIDAAYETATIYEYSKFGVEVDIYNAAEWFHGAASSGHVESMAEYGMCLELGCGVTQSDDEALDWYTKAAENGHITSNFSVGEMFEEARGGLPQSDTEAVLWYYKAASLGDEDSKKALKRLNDIARIVLPGWATTMNE
jgi:TPR repeat protein